MLAYYNDLGGWWDMLLSELWPFHPTDPRIFDRTFNQKVWIDWFESEVGDCVPSVPLSGHRPAVVLKGAPKVASCPTQLQIEEWDRWSRYERREDANELSVVGLCFRPKSQDLTYVQSSKMHPKWSEDRGRKP